jgi:hypothetical protein
MEYSASQVAVSCLKKALGQQVTLTEELPPLDEESQLILIPEDVLEVREIG